MGLQLPHPLYIAGAPLLVWLSGMLPGPQQIGSPLCQRITLPISQLYAVKQTKEESGKRDRGVKRRIGERVTNLEKDAKA